LTMIFITLSEDV